MDVYAYALRNGEEGLPILVRESSVPWEKGFVRTQDDVTEILNLMFGIRSLAEEYVYLLATDTKGKLIGVSEVSHGTINCSYMQPREILIRALGLGAYGLIIAHNHPSGDVAPSGADTFATKRLKEACTAVGFQLMDHIIIGRETSFSFAEQGLI